MDYRQAALGVLALIFLFNGAGVVRDILEGKKNGRQTTAGIVFIVAMAFLLYMAYTADPTPIMDTQPTQSLYYSAPTVDVQPTIDAFFRGGHTGTGGEAEVIRGYSEGGGLATPAHVEVISGYSVGGGLAEGTTGNHNPGVSTRLPRQP